MNKKKIMAYATAFVTLLSVPTVVTSVVATESVSAFTRINLGELIRNNTFDYNVATPWQLTKISPAEASIEVKDGKCYVTILKNGEDGRWDIQLRHRGIVLDQGHKYRVRFTVTADKDCYIYPKIADQGGSFNEYWNYNTYQKIQLNAGVPTTIDQIFQMNNATTRSAEFVFDLAGDCQAATFPYKLTFDDIYLTDLNHIQY
ncbi:carbohydrate binding domain-containing protein [Clostridium cellulovorans]|uniref:Carbohydrate-binding CenC domain protein n=2 Tax=Clostridium cellulovorans TaxID=1493 RepID=D9SS65_CLOC7|nr:carbohydrate binding domain-containing protein [Clostridium cellulovorans]AAF61310.1 endoglucanase N [Clostridium cellulovorans 743B]ADL52512.1 Carbohydrate-binding CenC domain protein [Clostridium cellulovorans 743B]